MLVVSVADFVALPLAGLTAVVDEVEVLLIGVVLAVAEGFAEAELVAAEVVALGEGLAVALADADGLAVAVAIGVMVAVGVALTVADGIAVAAADAMGDADGAAAFVDAL